MGDELPYLVSALIGPERGRGKRNVAAIAKRGSCLRTDLTQVPTERHSLSNGAETGAEQVHRSTRANANRCSTSPSHKEVE